jgi:hypothetical protein
VRSRNKLLGERRLFPIMSTSWRVILNYRLWNQEKYEKDFISHPEMRRLAQSKGNCRMISCPKLGDKVSFVIKGKIVMRGSVDSTGFENGTDHQKHSCNTDTVRAHAIPTEFIWIRINEVGLSENIRRTGQRTWAKMPV